MRMLLRAFLFFMTLLSTLISADVNADSVLMDFKLTSDGFGGQFKIVQILPDETSVLCRGPYIYAGLQGANTQSSTLIANKQKIPCASGSEFLSVNEIANAYADIVGRNTWVTITDANPTFWTGLCLVYYGNSSTLVSPITCANRSASNISCSISGNGVSLNHGTIQSQTANGNAVSKNVQLNCSGDTTAKIFAGQSFNSYTGKIPLTTDGSLSSLISINGVQSGVNGVSVDLVNGQNTLSVTSTLQATSKTISGGNYTGSGVLVVAPE